MGNSSLMYWQDQLGKVDPHKTVLEYKITAAKTIVPVVPNSIALTLFDAVSGQAAIDTHLGTTNEFLAAAFDATAMGTDAFAAVINMAGQVKSIVKMVVKIASGTGGATVAENNVLASSALAGGLLAECAVGSSGNVAVKAVSTGLDALTGGIISVELHWISK